ncbi:hypothetical protein H2204_006007 [Knufia peltigerae]|uniref:Uncharacterized protein n=1 Tax=Knufia peltigerae TaxID=1002370 RepID=A0AA38Y510_9EURO|nr:hypothetical protein H2204_006007 [Knufia peltigerae]
MPSRRRGYETDASEVWPRSSNSSTSVLRRSSNPVYEHIHPERWSSSSDGHLKDDLSPLSDILSMVNTSRTNDATQAQRTRIGSVISKTVGFAVIKEDNRGSVFGNPGLAAAPPPTVKGSKHADHLGGLSETNSEEDKIREKCASHHEVGLPAVLSTSGIGGNSHIYQTTSASLAQSSSSSSCPVVIDTNADTEVASSIGSAKMGPLGHLHGGLSKAAHAMREKVKKNVSFSLVDNVRLRTPSPTRSSNGACRISNAGMIER